MRARRLWRWALLLYLAGILVDTSLHLKTDLSTGDRAVESYEWVTGVEASLFWPLDLLAHAALQRR